MKELIDRINKAVEDKFGGGESLMDDIHDEDQFFAFLKQGQHFGCHYKDGEVRVYPDVLIKHGMYWYQYPNQDAVCHCPLPRYEDVHQYQCHWRVVDDTVVDGSDSTENFERMKREYEHSDDKGRWADAWAISEISYKMEPIRFQV